MKNKLAEYIGAAVIVAMVSLLAINSFVYTRAEGARLEAKVIRADGISRDEYRELSRKIDALKDLIIRMNNANN